jgi:small-conductance mechanosensitive channel
MESKKLLIVKKNAGSASKLRVTKAIFPVRDVTHEIKSKTRKSESNFLEQLRKNVSQGRENAIESILSENEKLKQELAKNKEELQLQMRKKFEEEDKLERAHQANQILQTKNWKLQQKVEKGFAFGALSGAFFTMTSQQGYQIYQGQDGQNFFTQSNIEEQLELDQEY